MKEEYLEIEELDINTHFDGQPPQQEQLQQNPGQAEFLSTHPVDFDGQYDDAMLRKLLKKFQMSFLYPFLKVCDITYRSLRYLSVDDINTAIRSVGHRAEFREKLFNWRRKRYRTNDVIIECEKLTPPTATAAEKPTVSANNSTAGTIINTVKPSQANIIISQLPTTTTQTAVVTPEMAATSNSTSGNNTNNAFQNAIKPFKRDTSYLDTSLQEMIDELPTEMEFDVEPKRPKLFETTVELRETRLNVQLNLDELLDESLFGPVMKAFYQKNGYLERKHRDELIQSIVDYVITHEIKLHSSDFNKIVDMIISIFPNEEESRDYYFINRKGKRNPMGRLYTKYYNTLKRMRVRDIHQEFTLESTLMPVVSLQEDTTSMMTTTSTASTTAAAAATQMMSSANVISTSASTMGNSNSSNNNGINNYNNNGGNNNNSNSANTQIDLNEDEFQELIQLDDTSISAIKNFLRCQGLDWDDVKTMWSKTYLARQEDVEHSTIKDVLQQWPKYLNARGMELFDIDFRLKFSRNKATALHKKWQTFAQKIFSYYQGNIKDDMCKGLFALCKSKPGKDTEDYIITVLLNAIMLPMARYRDALGNRRKISIVEAVDLFAIRVNTLEDLDQKREEFSIKYGDIHTDYTPLIVVVGDNNINIHEIYVHFDVALYEMPDFISALDCCMKIYRVLNLPYPSSNEYSWTFIQRYFYEIMLPDDMKCPSMSSLITYLKF
ncbi:uncharacterized protein LOC111685906 isoform X1 [Lucilia cuprina]|uniref:uncharacterized protein LOC111685906 isoform X1 n=1 Tax=Lucilia cuprina TaxID=7375 RepID=UPI001F0587A5|nr:uncharacterized protein LOC111685906 isoform X1 [Lucilia cuprina]